MKRDDWEREAANWIAWVRTLGDDAYRDYSPGFFDEVVAAPGDRTLEIGCGEGRVIRDLVTRGHRAFGIDASETMVRAAREMDAQASFAVADAAALPYRDESFDLVVASTR